MAEGAYADAGADACAKRAASAAAHVEKGGQPEPTLEAIGTNPNTAIVSISTDVP